MEYLRFMEHVDGFMTMGDWIQVPGLVGIAHSYRRWTEGLPECHCFRRFLRARPGLPWHVGGCHVSCGTCLGSILRPVVHTLGRCCQNPQCFAVQGPYTGTTPPLPPRVHPSLYLPPWRPALHQLDTVLNA